MGGWPPFVCVSLGLILDPFSIPMLNTVLLLSSGFRITLGHFGLLFGDGLFFLLGVSVTLV
jgi:heme/copper-type cytochrome/quinol oxidase subunit 3